MTSLKTVIVLVCVGLSPLGAEELDPRLAPIATVYQKKIEEINIRENMNKRQARRIYLDQLKEGEEKATKSGNTQDLAVILSERSLVQGGAPMPLPDPTLPKLLQAKRKIYCKAYEDSESAVSKETEDLNSKYLAALAKIEPADGEDLALARQITEEKKRVIAEITGPITNLQTQLPGTIWQPVKDPNHPVTFTKDNRYIHWRFTTPDPNTVIVHWNENSRAEWKLDKDGKTLTQGGVPDFKFVSREK